MALTDTAIRNAKPGAKPVKLFDAAGLYLLVQPTGSKLWRLKYRFGGSEKLLALGAYPDGPLRGARERRDAERRKLADGIDPGQARKADNAAKKVAAANSFEAVARAWWANWSPTRSARHADQVLRRLEADVLSEIGTIPVASITAPQILAVSIKIERRGAVDIAKRAYQTCGQVLRYAVAHGLAERNAAADVKPSDALKPTRKENYARVDVKDVPELLRKIDGYDGSVYTRLALRLMALTFVRTSELIGARWKEFDLDAAEWRIPPERMKMKTEDAAHRAAVTPGAGRADRPRQAACGPRPPISRRARSRQADEQQHDPVRALPHGLPQPNDRPRLPRHRVDDLARARPPARPDRAATRAPGAQLRERELQPCDLPAPATQDDAGLGGSPGPSA